MSDRPVALVSGASMGIGAAFAEALAARRYDVALVARSGPALDELAARLRVVHGVRAETFVADLADPAAVEATAAAVEAAFGRVDVLVNNAGFGAHGRFEGIEPHRVAGQIRVNIEALVALTQRFVPGMLARRSGGIINVASVAAFQPVPFLAVYAATKAFVLSFSEALAEEYRGRGVRVLALCPGATATNFFKTAGEGAQVGAARAPQSVVATALRAYDRGQAVAVDGSLNRFMSASPRFFPRRLIARIAGRMLRPAAG